MPAGRKAKLIESKFTVEEVSDLLVRIGGLVYPAARHMDVSRSALVKYIERHQEAKKAMEYGREQTIDKAESVILRAVEGSLPGCTSRDQIDAAKILLMQLDRGRRRGYGEKVSGSYRKRRLSACAFEYSYSACQGGRW